jgi:hypothetical protein
MRHLMRSLSKTAIALLGIVLVTACNDATAVNGDASGTYNLSAVNNAALPVTVAASATDTVVLKSGSVTINADGTFTETLSVDITTGGVTTNQTNACPGVYSQSGNSFTFAEVSNTDGTCGGSYSVRWDGADTVSLFLTGFQLDYIKVNGL